jgi:hypothetical protein
VEGKITVPVGNGTLVIKAGTTQRFGKREVSTITENRL